MDRLALRLAVGLLMAGAVAAQSGCVSSSSYELARSHAENAKLLYQNEQRRAQELAATNKQLKQQIEDLETKLRTTREQLARTEQEWKEARDELLKLKIEREQQQPRRSREPADSPEAKRRLKDLLRQLEALLEPQS